ncbi:hypothetical protein [Paenibacillus sp. GCM10028914]|uniref:hypothetical protein n=1 Tax=Paenibacillus sp. GCM10028914 TaxID=3273416 RepID=UPI003607B0AA
MSIDRFILKKLDSCEEMHTRLNLVRLFQIRIYKAQTAEETLLSHSYGRLEHE